MRVPSARSPGVGLAKVPQRAYLDLAGATAWDISPVGSRGNLDLMQYALISFDVQLILAQMGPLLPPPMGSGAPGTPACVSSSTSSMTGTMAPGSLPAGCCGRWTRSGYSWGIAVSMPPTTAWSGHCAV